MADEPDNQETEEEDDPNTLRLEAREYDTIGPIHCGVTREGLVAIGGQQFNIEDGEEQTAEYVGITVRREGEQYTFSKTV